MKHKYNQYYSFEEAIITIYNILDLYISKSLIDNYIIYYRKDLNSEVYDISTYYYFVRFSCPDGVNALDVYFEIQTNYLLNKLSRNNLVGMSFKDDYMTDEKLDSVNKFTYSILEEHYEL